MGLRPSALASCALVTSIRMCVPVIRSYSYLVLVKSYHSMIHIPESSKNGKGKANAYMHPISNGNIKKTTYIANHE